jgi:hypothetical protein
MPVVLKFTNRYLSNPQAGLPLAHPVRGVAPQNTYYTF